MTVTFLPQSFSDSGGASNFGETEQFNIVASATDKPAPTAQLASPGNGETITAQSLNARRYIDVTFVSQDGSAINPTSIDGNELKISGPGVADLAVNSSTGTPLLVGPPVLIAGTDAQATSRTYRYYLKDKDSHNGVELFGAGEVTVEFIGGPVSTAKNPPQVKGHEQKITTYVAGTVATIMATTLTITTIDILSATVY